VTAPKAPSMPESQLLLQLILDASPDIVYVYDRITRTYPFVSGRVRAVLGYEPSQIQESTDGVEALIHPADLARVRTHYARQESLQDDEVAVAEYRVAHLTGSYRLLRCRQKALSRTADGAVKLVLGMATDVTDHHEAKSELHDLRKRLSSMQDEERRRVALEMHDTVMQHLVGAALLLNSLEKVVSSEGSISGTLERAQASLSRALSDMVTPLVA
jgi:PAS domain S-box-containing protein